MKLETKLEAIETTVNKTDEKLDNLSASFVTKEQHATDILRLEKRIGSSSTAKTIVTVVATTLITALVLYVFNDLTG